MFGILAWYSSWKNRSKAKPVPVKYLRSVSTQYSSFIKMTYSVLRVICVGHGAVPDIERIAQTSADTIYESTTCFTPSL